jgi:hypothetical protein
MRNEVNYHGTFHEKSLLLDNFDCIFNKSVKKQKEDREGKASKQKGKAGCWNGK